jgi:NAD(P)-dependent dehydrogenase (short-subunit alcohol dehydrogenase family)
LGRAIALEFGDHGAKVVLNYFTNREAAEELEAEMKQKGQDVCVVQAGVAHPDDCNRLIEETVKRYGGIDVLVNNAGVNRDRTIRRLSVEEWREVIATDLDSVFYCTYAAVPHMIERGGGRIINMSSIVGQMGNLGQSNYAAAKAGIVGFSKSAAQEFARYNITVNALCPGFIETEMVTNLTEEVQKALIAKIPMGRFGKPEEVAQITRFLATEGGYVTGAQININGGMYMQ